MMNSRIKLSVIGMAGLAFMTFSCKEDKKSDTATQPMDHQMEEHGEMKSTASMDQDGEGSVEVAPVLDAYLQVKDALVSDDQEKAADAGDKLASSLSAMNIKGFEAESQDEISEIVEVAREHGEHIAKSDMAHQREHFEALSKDMTDLLAITGTPKKLYQQYCPMYNNNKGGMWLSANEEIRNPYFGAKMLKCGEVQQEIL